MPVHLIRTTLTNGITAMLSLTLVAGCGSGERIASVTVSPSDRPSRSADGILLDSAAAPPTAASVGATAGPAIGSTSEGAATKPVPPTMVVVSPAPADAAVPNAISVDSVDQVERCGTLEGHTDRVKALAVAGNGGYVASSSRDKTVRLWDLESGQVVRSFSVNKVNMNGIAFSPDGSLLASADAIWDVESGQTVHKLERGRVDPGCVAFSPDGSSLAVALESRPIRLWDVASGRVVRTFEECADNAPSMDGVVFSIEFSPDGTLLAAGVHGGTVRLWHVESGQTARTLGHGSASDDVHGVAFSPDGRLLASAGNDNTVQLWDVASGQVLHVLRHRDGLYNVAFSPDGRLVASVGVEHAVILWDVESGRILRSLPHADELMAVAFSPDGTKLVSGGYDNMVYVWGIPR